MAEYLAKIAACLDSPLVKRLIRVPLATSPDRTPLKTEDKHNQAHLLTVLEKLARHPGEGSNDNGHSSGTKEDIKSGSILRSADW